MATTSHQTVRLERGRHRSPERGACVVELASMLAGEPFSDRPRSVCPVVAAFLRRVNDDLPDEQRQRLYPYAPRIVGSAGGWRQRGRRRRTCIRWFCEMSGSSRWRALWLSIWACEEGAAQACARAALERGIALDLADLLLDGGRHDHEGAPAGDAPAVAAGTADPLPGARGAA